MGEDSNVQGRAKCFVSSLREYCSKTPTVRKSSYLLQMVQIMIAR